MMSPFRPGDILIRLPCWIDHRYITLRNYSLTLPHSLTILTEKATQRQSSWSCTNYEIVRIYIRSHGAKIQGVD
jgi:hypothetical protein